MIRFTQVNISFCFDSSVNREQYETLKKIINENANIMCHNLEKEGRISPSLLKVEIK